MTMDSGLERDWCNNNHQSTHGEINRIRMALREGIERVHTSEGFLPWKKKYINGAELCGGRYVEKQRAYRYFILCLLRHHI